jgi:hypothetical protein
LIASCDFAGSLTQGNTEARAAQDFVASQLDRESIANAQRRAAEFVPKKQGKDILDTKH